MNTPLIIGRQTFDGLGRQLTVEAAGYITQFEYIEGQIPPSANVLPDGKRVDFTYEPALNDQLLSVKPEGEAVQALTYHPLGMPTSASGALGTEAFGFSTAGQPDLDTWTVDDTQHHTQWHYSMSGLLQGFKDAAGENHHRSFDAQGRVQETQAGRVKTRYSYDAFSRPITIVVEDPDNARTLKTSLTYDSLGREATRTFTTTAAGANAQPIINTLTQTLGYSALDQITSRSWAEDGKKGKETFEYDLRGRLVSYTADPLVAPQDPFGNRIVRQVFSFNMLNGHEKVVTEYTDRTADEARFTYAKNNATQVVKVTHTHASWPKEVTLVYDDCGRVVSDSLGRSMVWNAQDRLTEVRQDKRTCLYGYTAHGRLADRTVDGQLSRSFFSGEELTHEQTGDESLLFHSSEQGLFAVSKLTKGIRHTTLLGTDAQGSVRLEADSSVRTRRYCPYGVEAHDDHHIPFGYAGQRHEPLTGWQILGDYRPYDPVLMCFLSPDRESPFGRGGINPYAYCAGDPVNRIDPDGHSWVNYAVAGAGLALAVVATIASWGAASAAIAAGWSASAAMVVGTAALDVISLATGTAALAMELSGSDPSSASILGWISLGTGMATGVMAIASRFGKAASHANSTAKRIGSVGHKNDMLGNIEVLYSKKSRIEVAYHKRLWNQDLRAFETHGGSDGKLMNSMGALEDATTLALREIAPRLADYPKGRPLVLLACKGGSSGAAQQIANALKRPVIGYDKTIYILQPKQMAADKYFYLGNNDIFTNLPTQKVSFFKRFSQRNAPTVFGKKYRELATYQTYLPQ